MCYYKLADPNNAFVLQGSMTVVVQEFDGCFTHSIQVEENSTSFELPCHSKIRKWVKYEARFSLIADS